MSGHGFDPLFTQLPERSVCGAVATWLPWSSTSVPVSKGARLAEWLATQVTYPSAERSSTSVELASSWDVVVGPCVPDVASGAIDWTLSPIASNVVKVASTLVVGLSAAQLVNEPRGPTDAVTFPFASVQL